MEALGGPVFLMLKPPDPEALTVGRRELLENAEARLIEAQLTGG